LCEEKIMKADKKFWVWSCGLWRLSAFRRNLLPLSSGQQRIFKLILPHLPRTANLETLRTGTATYKDSWCDCTIMMKLWQQLSHDT
jgi:hypothetical protein